MARISTFKGENDDGGKKNGDGKSGGDGTNGGSIILDRNGPVNGLVPVLVLLLLCRVVNGESMFEKGDSIGPPKGPQRKLSSKTASNISSSILQAGSLLLILQGDGGGGGGGVVVGGGVGVGGPKYGSMSCRRG